MPNDEPETYEYHIKTVWQKENVGTVTTGNGVILPFSAPPEFDGHSGVMNPEDAFVASVAMCAMVNFLHFVRRAKLGLVSAEIDAKGTLEEEEEGKWAITRIVLRPRVRVSSGKELKRAERALVLAEKNCLIKNSMRTRVTMEPDVGVIEVDESDGVQGGGFGTCG